MSMTVLIREAGKPATLSIIDPANGVDYIMDFVGNTGALTDGQFEYDGERDVYICDCSTYTWWKHVVQSHQLLADRIFDLSKEHGSDEVMQVLEGVGSDDLDVQPALANQALDEKFGG